MFYFESTLIKNIFPLVDATLFWPYKGGTYVKLKIFFYSSPPFLHGQIKI